MVESSLKSRIGLVLGPALAIGLLMFFDLDPQNPAVTRTAAVALLMATWWITEAIPISATALVPIALFPLLGIMPGKVVATTYFNNIIFLFIGGFIIALAMEKWELHRRIALRIILLVGSSPRRLVFGFMLATAFLSMWISNTATTMMMVPIALAVIKRLKESATSEGKSGFAAGLLIGIAYAASIGGIATLIGTPPNLSFSRILNIYFPEAPEISFAQWFLFGLPTSAIMLILAWGVIVMVFVPRQRNVNTDSTVFREEHRQLGKMTYEEKMVMCLFGLLAAMWLFRKDIPVGSFTIPGWSNLFGNPKYIDDGTSAIMVALLLFLIPSKSEKGRRLLDWGFATRIPWGIVLLFGGGFALASGFKESGLSTWVASQLTGLGDVPSIFMIMCTSSLMTFLTELTSNTATTEMILPLLGSLSQAIQINPLLLMIPATLSASCAFMLPVATPPNAIIFGSGEVRIEDMVKVGLIMNLVGIVLITAIMYLIGLPVFDIQLGVQPDWAVAK